MRKDIVKYPLAKSLSLTLVIFSILAGSAVLADGDSRLATQAEKDFTKSVQTAFSKALPPGPAGWTRPGSPRSSRISSGS